MTHLAILGASGHGKVVADTASLISEWEQITFFDDDWQNIDNDTCWPVVGDTASLLECLDSFDGVVIAIGDNAIRQQRHELLVANAAPLVSIVHPRAFISPSASIADGSVVFAQAAINIHAHVGASTIINTGATVDHDCHLGDFVHISPGANLGGNVTVGQRSWVGIGAAVRQGMTIGADAVIGAGATVVNAIPDGHTVVGSPARPIGTS